MPIRSTQRSDLGMSAKVYMPAGGEMTHLVCRGVAVKSVSSEIARAFATSGLIASPVMSQSSIAAGRARLS